MCAANAGAYRIQPDKRSGAWMGRGRDGEDDGKGHRVPSNARRTCGGLDTFSRIGSYHPDAESFDI